jgi:hypothetical protein
VPEDDFERGRAATRRDRKGCSVVSREGGFKPLAVLPERQIATLRQDGAKLRGDLLDVLVGEVIDLRGDLQKVPSPPRQT